MVDKENEFAIIEAKLIYLPELDEGRFVLDLICTTFCSLREGRWDVLSQLFARGSFVRGISCVREKYESKELEFIV